MLFRFDELKPGKETFENVALPQEALDTQIDNVRLEAAQAQLKFRIDPLGYVVKYNLRANASLPCVRCGETFPWDVDKSDWVSFRVQQPEEHNILLDASDMNVRFISDLTLDLVRFVGELVELELPPYPRHEDTDPNCQVAWDGASNNDVQAEQRSSSPFDVLSKYLDQAPRD